MTGRDLIVYIMEHGLEDEPIFKDGKFIGFLTIEEAAVKKDVGPATIMAAINMGTIEAEYIKGGFYIQAENIK